jgi:hypothetical protein
VRSFLRNAAGALIAVLFGAVAAYGIDGGPPYPAGTNVVGTYAGVLTPKASPCPQSSVSPAPPCERTIASCAANSIGVFAIGVPQNSLGTGSFVMFAQGRVFSGTIQGVADPGKATLKGVLTARYDFTVTGTPTPCPCDAGGSSSPCPSPVASCTPSSSSQHITALANGKLNTRITTSSSGIFTTSATRLTGNATLDISNGTVSGTTFEQNVDCEIFLKVSGFKQSNTAITGGTGLPTGTL